MGWRHDSVEGLYPGDRFGALIVASWLLIEETGWPLSPLVPAALRIHLPAYSVSGALRQYQKQTKTLIHPLGAYV